MTTSTTRILFVGDMHLGTRPARLPAALGDADRFGPAAAWGRAVDAALEHRVHAVALAGDVVDRANALFEARRPLDRGLARLADAGIPVVAVAGNHDTETLPGLARGDGRLRLLGAGGTWGELLVDPPGGPPVRLVGWSFPREHVDTSPLDTPPPPPRDGVVTLGLLHADLDAAGSRYAPVSTAALRACGYQGWFLGHVHTPGAVPADGAPFYLGSLTGLDPTETGTHGPVLVDVAPDGARRAARLPLAPLRWERLEVPCDGVDDPAADPAGILMARLTGHVAREGLAAGTALGVRAEFTGAVARPAALAAALAGLDPAALVTEIDGVMVFVDRVTSEARGRVDLADLARGRDPAALLAHRLLVLEGAREDDALLTHLLERARDATAAVDELPACRRLDPDRAEAALRRDAAAAARRLLDRMLAAGGAP